MSHPQPLSFQARKSTTLAISKIFLVAIAQLPYVHGAPLFVTKALFHAQEEEGEVKGPDLALYLGVAAALVLLGGAFAGLTIALMGQDEIYLQVIKTSGEGKEKKHAAKVLKLLNKGKHWVLVTLLLSNVITNETLPIVLDRSLGGGWPAVLGSTVLIVIFGEIAPQSVCVRYGLPIGAWMSPFVLALMYLLAPVAWPTAKLLDYLLGEDHGTVYKKAGLKTLVSLHKTMGEAGHQLNADEVTIISAVLDLKDKAVGNIMTEMKDVFVLSVDDILDEETMDEILAMGYSRIPVHANHNPNDFVGMLLVKMLITYDPEDAKPVRDFALATLPETRPETSCLDIINFFQEGKSHMVLVSDNPGGDSGALGVVTLEDVIEELIGEEIIDESDVFIDVHKAIRRLNPAPRTRYREPKVPKGKVVSGSGEDMTNGQNGTLVDINENSDDVSRERTTEAPPPKSKAGITDYGSPRATTLMLRRRSSTQNSDKGTALRVSANAADVKEHLSHLGPSNLASRPRTTRYQNFKIKPGQTREPPTPSANIGIVTPRRVSDSGIAELNSGIGEGLVASAGKHASDGVQALHVGYGTLSQQGTPSQKRNEGQTEETSYFPAQSTDLPTITEPEAEPALEERSSRDTRPRSATRDSERSQSTIGSLRKRRNDDRSPGYSTRGPARSGSITENIIDVNGVRKVVLELTSSDESNGKDGDEEVRSPIRPTSSQHGSGETSQSNAETQLRGGGGGSEEANPSQTSKSKNKKKKKKKKNAGKGEQQPLLG